MNDKQNLRKIIIGELVVLRKSVKVAGKKTSSGEEEKDLPPQEEK
jgi:hypothetical protein